MESEPKKAEWTSCEGRERELSRGRNTSDRRSSRELDLIGHDRSGAAERGGGGGGNGVNFPRPPME